MRFEPSGSTSEYDPVQMEGGKYSQNSRNNRKATFDIISMTMFPCLFVVAGMVILHGISKFIVDWSLIGWKSKTVNTNQWKVKKIRWNLHDGNHRGDVHRHGDIHHHDARHDDLVPNERSCVHGQRTLCKCKLQRTKPTKSNGMKNNFWLFLVDWFIWAVPEWNSW